MQIREAQEQDCMRLLEHVQELADFERAPDEVSITYEEFITAGFGHKPIWKAFVAEQDGKIEGFALYYIRFSTWKGSRLYLEDFYVTPSARGKGLGTLLFETIIKEAQTKGFNGVSWQVLDWNKPAIKFYSKYKSAIESGWLNASLSKEQLSQISVANTNTST
jgi:GNAT superfamily N-acetyltransferase